MRLRSLALKDAKGMLEWMQDPKVNRFFRFDASSMKKEDIETYIRESWEDEKNKHFAITGDDDEYLGTISLKNIDTINQTAEYAISLRKAFHGSGIAAFATEELLRIAFEEYGLNRVYLNVLSDNTRAIHFYEKMGFLYEGEFCEHIIMDGEKKNLKWFAILKEKEAAI